MKNQLEKQGRHNPGIWTPGAVKKLVKICSFFLFSWPQQQRKGRKERKRKKKIRASETGMKKRKN